MKSRLIITGTYFLMAAIAQAQASAFEVSGPKSYSIAAEGTCYLTRSRKEYTVAVSFALQSINFEIPTLQRFDMRGAEVGVTEGLVAKVSDEISGLLKRGYKPVGASIRCIGSTPEAQIEMPLGGASGSVLDASYFVSLEPRGKFLGCSGVWLGNETMSIDEFFTKTPELKWK